MTCHETAGPVAGVQDKETILRQYPSKLFVELTTLCNLSCGMCVKQNGEGGIREGSMTPEIFDAMAPAFPHLEAVILNGIGESLLHPLLESYIRKAKRFLPQGAWVGFQTNGMLLSDSRAESLLDAGLDRICLSLDTISDESFRSIRSGGELKGITSAFAGLNRARARSAGRDLKIGIEFVLMRSNLAVLPEAIHWAGRAGASFAIVTQLLPYQKELVEQAAYDTNTAAAIAIYERWKTIASKDGLDIRRYLDTLTKVGRTADEERTVSLVGKMQAEAEAQAVNLNLERLLRRDEEWLARVDEVFQQARTIAGQEGIDLILPEMAPRNTRKCEFVEGGGAFVSWEGDIHPCYFLWHRYNCYVGGWQKRVKPWTFGNLREQDILEIWNSESSRSFRQNVLGYRFPFCYDCGFALCDYVGEADFEQDCYIERVPCGACLWCTGLFHCLQ